jgi:hypothetical protein
MDESTVEMRRLIGRVAERHGIHIDLSDPAFYVLSLNEFALEESTKTIVEQIRRAAGDVPSPRENRQKVFRKPLCDVPEPSERSRHASGTPLESSMLLFLSLTIMVY